jgi:hypothetical protein
MNIFDLVTAQEISVFYTDFASDREPYLGEELWPAKKQLGLKLESIKAARGLPVVLKASAYDVKAVPRLRKGFEKTSTEMPYFKESMYVDEVTRQELNTVIATGNQTMIDLVLNKVYGDQATLIDAARARREMMRMMLLTTGTVMVSSNGQDYDYDFRVPAQNKVTVTKNWDDPEADIIGDINDGLEVVNSATGTRPSRGVVNRATWLKIKKNKAISAIVYPVTAISGNALSLTDTQVSSVLSEHCQVELIIYDKRFVDDTGAQIKYVPDNTASFFPSGALGNTYFGTTPQESDLMTGAAANVSIVDTGVSITTTKQIDPVNVETIAAMICLPDLPEAEKILIIDTAGA